MVTAIKGGFEVNLGATSNGAALKGLVKTSDVRSLLDSARSHGGFQTASNRYEFRLFERDGQAVLQLKERNWVSRFKDKVGRKRAERAESRQKAMDAIDRRYGLGLVPSRPQATVVQARDFAQKLNVQLDIDQHEARMADYRRAIGTPPPQGEALLSVHPRSIQVPGGRLPESMAFRAGASEREKLSATLQSDLEKADQGHQFAPLAEDGVSDPRAKQFMIDVSRMDISYGGRFLGKQGPAGLQTLRDGLQQTFGGSTTQAQNALRDLPHLLNQQGAIGAYAVASMQGNQGGAPWFTNADGVQSINVQPEGDPANSLLISAECEAGHTSPSMMYNKSGLGLMDEQGQPLSFKDKTSLQLRYTPSDQAGQPGKIEYLDVHSTFSLNLLEAQRDAAIAKYKQAVTDWLDSGQQSYEQDMAGLRKMQKALDAWTVAENSLLLEAGEETMGREAAEDMRSAVLQPHLRGLVAGMSPEQRTRWATKIQNSPGLDVLAGSTGMVNDALLDNPGAARDKHLNGLVNLYQFSATLAITVEDELGVAHRPAILPDHAEGSEGHIRFQNLMNEVR